MKQRRAVLNKKTKRVQNRCFKDRWRWDPVVLRYREAAKQIDVKHFSQILQPVIGSSLFLCRLAELHCGGGQIVTTGAPQQFSVSKWKPTPTPTHRFIPDLAQHFYYLSIRFFSVHVSLYTLPATEQQQTHRHVMIFLQILVDFCMNTKPFTILTHQHANYNTNTTVKMFKRGIIISTYTIVAVWLKLLLFFCHFMNFYILFSLISPFICIVSVLVLL